MSSDFEKISHERYLHFKRIMGAYECRRFILMKTPSILQRFRRVKPVSEHLGEKGETYKRELMPMARLPRNHSNPFSDHKTDYYLTEDGHVLLWKNENKNYNGAEPYHNVFLAEFKIKRFTDNEGFLITQISYLKHLKTKSFCDIVSRGFLTDERLKKYSKGKISLHPVED